MKKLHIDCACTSPDHLVTFTFYDPIIEDDIVVEDSELYLTYYLTQPNSVFERIKIAIKFILGMDTTNQFNDVVISKESIPDLIDFLKPHGE